MSTQIGGIAANISGHLPAAVNIASTTDASPIAVTTSTPHGLLIGDTVDITKHAVNVAANGVWAVTVTGGSSFTIPTAGSGAGAGSATGIVQSLALGPTFPIPADGVDNEDAASVGVPFEAGADRTAFLATAIGLNKVAYVLEDGVTDDTGAGYATFTLTDATWKQAAVPWTVFTGSGADAPLHNGDTLLVEADINYAFTDAASGTLQAQFQAALFVLLAEPGVAFAALTRVPCSARFGQSVPVSGDGLAHNGSLHLAGALPITGHGQKFQVTIQIRAVFANEFQASTLNLAGDWRIRAVVLRPTGLPQ
jgi:hypothetical protein